MNQLLSVPFHYLLTAAAAAGAILAGWAYARFSGAARSLNSGEHRQSTRVLVDTGFNALLIFLAGWKLSPLLFSFQTILESPIALLYLPGGAAGTALGITGAAGYIIFRHRHILSGQTAYARHLMRGLGIMLAVVLIIWIPGSRIAAILQQPQGTGGTTAAAVHTAAPDFTLNSLAGEEVSLSDLQGTPTVLNFWATWCPPCRAEFPELVALQQEFGESLQVVGINLTHSERSRQDVADFIARYEPGFLHLLDQDGAVQARYNVRVVPTTLILDSRGIIVHRRVGAVSAAVLRNHIP